MLENAHLKSPAEETKCDFFAVHHPVCKLCIHDAAQVHTASLLFMHTVHVRLQALYLSGLSGLKRTASTQ